MVSKLLQQIDLTDESLVYQVGEQADAIYVVISGFIILRQPMAGGASRERLIGPGAVFGAADVICGTMRSASARISRSRLAPPAMGWRRMIKPEITT